MQTQGKRERERERETAFAVNTAADMVRLSRGNGMRRESCRRGMVMMRKTKDKYSHSHMNVCHALQVLLLLLPLSSLLASEAT